MSSRSCITCSKPCYPTEKVAVSDLWIHKNGCLKCSVCFTTLSLSSVYVGPSPVNPKERQIYCSKDVPKIVHTSIVDSLALKAAMNAPNPTTIPHGIYQKRSGGIQGSIRFKGLTLRSKAIKAGLNAPKLGIAGMMKTQVVVGNVGDSPLDSWDIMHAMSVQSQVSSPIRDHPAIHAQRTGSSANYFPMPSQPLDPQYRGCTGISKAGKDDEEVTIEPDLVKNLIKVFQLDTIDKVEITPPPPTPAPTPARGVLGTIPSFDFSMNSFESDNTLNCGTIKPSQYDTLALPCPSIRTIGTLGSRRNGTVRRSLTDIFAPPSPPTPPTGVASVNRSEKSVASMDNSRARILLEALLPHAAHLIPLPEDTGGEDDSFDSDAHQDLLSGLEKEDLEIVMLFEELPEPSSVSSA